MSPAGQLPPSASWQRSFHRLPRLNLAYLLVQPLPAILPLWCWKKPLYCDQRGHRRSPSPAPSWLRPLVSTIGRWRYPWPAPTVIVQVAVRNSMRFHMVRQVDHVMRAASIRCKKCHQRLSRSLSLL
ncbi:hypothetical protein LY78DRAFT_118639 [Colletotrichum sublineola]|nr:hypothetical protein LY78DRAFT_118639 [Colletotrichum sublineola]